MITEENNSEPKINQKEVIGLKLFDKQNPEMITKISLKDIDNLSVLKSLLKSENEYRKNLGYPSNIFEDALNNNLILRTSLDGWRSNQAVEIIKGIIDEDKKSIDDGLNNRLKNVIARG